LWSNNTAITISLTALPNFVYHVPIDITPRLEEIGCVDFLFGDDSKPLFDFSRADHEKFTNLICSKLNAENIDGENFSSLFWTLVWITRRSLKEYHELLKDKVIVEKLNCYLEKINLTTANDCRQVVSPQGGVTKLEN